MKRSWKSVLLLLFLRDVGSVLTCCPTAPVKRGLKRQDETIQVVIFFYLIFKKKFPLQGRLIIYLFYCFSLFAPTPVALVESFFTLFYFQPHKVQVLIHCGAITRTLVPGWRHRCFSQPLLAESEVGGGSCRARSPRLWRRGAEVSAQNDHVQPPSSRAVLWFRRPDSHAFVAPLYLPRSKVRTVSAGGATSNLPPLKKYIR